ncbi:MAG: hypothetical protein JOZ54_00345 [Acidobacteria bacterium]|nr:hypothetical protein [Acidobacteriota bacterium]
MWTTSSSRAELLFVLLIAGCATTPEVAPEAPRAELRAASRATAAPRADVANFDGPIEIASATVRVAAEMPELMQRTGASRDMRILDVRTERPLDLLRDAAAVIVLDGQPLKETIPIDDQHLIAVVPSSAVRGESSIAVTYLGAESYSMSRKRVTVRMP